MKRKEEHGRGAYIDAMCMYALCHVHVYEGRPTHSLPLCLCMYF